MANTDILDSWVQQRVQSRVSRGVVNTPPKPQTKIRTNPLGFIARSNMNTLNTVGNSAPARMAMGGLRELGDILSRPLQAVGSGGKAGEQARVSGKSYFGQAKEAIKGAKRGLTGEELTTPGSYVADDVLKIKNPIARAGVTFATDMVADPLNAFGIAGKAKSVQTLKRAITGETFSKAPVVSKVIEKARQTPFVAKIVEGTVNPYFRNPEAGKIIEGAKEATRTRLASLFSMVDESQAGLTSAEKVRVGQLLEGSVATGKTDGKLIEIAEKFRKMGEEVGKEAVNEGLLSPESYAKLKGNYMHHMWNTVLDPKYADKFGISDVPKIDSPTFLKRKGATGYVKEFQAPTFKGLGSEIKSVEAAKMYKNLGKTFGKVPTNADESYDLAQKGYKYTEGIGKSRGGEVLNKTLLPEEINDYIKRSREKSGTIEKAFDYAMGLWKQGKTVWNPAYHVRNFMSNQILSDLQTGKGIPGTVIDYFKTTKKYLTKADDPYIKEARRAGLVGTKYFGEAVEDLLNGAYNKTGFWEKVRKAPNQLQTAMEETAKLNVFTEMRKQGKSVKEAMDLAEEAIFSPYRINPSERKVLGRVVPFYSFTRQAAPFIGKKLATHPERFAKYIKGERAIESLTPPENEENLPDYMKGMVRTPLKNKEGQRKYFNPQYIYPWGNFMQESKGLPFGLNLNPLVEEVFAQKANKDMYFGSDIVKPGEPNSIGKRVEHVARTLAPTVVNTIKDKVIPALQGRPDTQGRSRDIKDVALGEGMGLKMYPFDPVAGGKSKSAQRYYIGKDANDRIKEVQRNKSFTPEEKKKKIKAILDFRTKRLKELQ